MSFFSLILATLLTLSSSGVIQDIPTVPGHQATSESSAQNLVTVRYYDPNTPSFFVRFYGPRFVFTGNVVRFYSLSSGLIHSISFPIHRPGVELSSGNVTQGVAGTGILRIKLFEVPPNSPDGFPDVNGTPLAVKDVNFTDLVADSEFSNIISLVEDDFIIAQDVEYWLGLFIEEASDDAQIDFIKDQGSADESNINYYPARTLIYSADANELRPEQGFGDPNPNLYLDITLEELPPFISHTPPKELISGTPFTFTAPVVDDENQTTSVSLIYSTGNSPGEQVLPMTPSTDGTYSATLEGELIPSSGFYYRIELTSDGVAPKILGPFSPAIRIEDQGLTYTLPVSGRTTDSYRLFSVPIDLDNSLPQNVLVDDLGEYNPREWRLWGVTGLGTNQSYVEFPNSGSLDAGRAFWLATTQSNVTIDTEPGALKPLWPATIDLRPGWNYIGSPFNHTLEVNQLSLQSGLDIDIRYFNGFWNVHAGAINPFEGYAIPSFENDVLWVDPFPVLDSGKKPLQPQPTSQSHSPNAWRLQIEATTRETKDIDTYLGVSEEALNHWDRADRPEPPVIGEYVSVYFPRSEWQTPFHRFSTDIRQPLTQAETWSFDVETGSPTQVDLQVNGIESLPDHYHAILHDKTLNLFTDLRETNTYTLISSNDGSEERFELQVGPMDERPPVIPTEFETLSLGHFPNPSSGSTTLHFSLPSAQFVTLSIYDIQGRKVATLAQDQWTERGTNVFLWDGHDEQGRLLGSGTYFSRLTTEESTVVEKLVLLR